jgi:hypothetical protein
MAERFDPYHELLGIPSHEQPPNHYRLLGISLFETNRRVIGNAALQRSKFLRSLGISDYGDECQRLLNEVAAAKICLMDEKKQAAYDAQLRSQLGPPAPPLPLPPRGDEPAPPRTPWQEPSPPETVRDWVIGRAPKCDVVIQASAVSGIHCRLSKTGDGRFWVEDLGSRNGTYVNRVPIAGKVPVCRYDRITLGKSTPMPWPDDVDAK